MCSSRPVIEDDHVGLLAAGDFHVAVGAQQRGQAGADDRVRMGDLTLTCSSCMSLSSI
jgi:hypothetical protein